MLEMNMSKTNMIRAHKASLPAASIGKKRGVMATDIVESLDLAMIISTHNKFNIPQSANLRK